MSTTDRSGKSGRVVKTWNLTVADLPEFVANGVLVHNCADCLADVFQYGQIPKKAKKSSMNDAPRTGFLLNTLVDDMLEEQERVGVYRVMAPGVRRV